MKIFFVNGIRAGEELEYVIPEISVGREDDNVLRIPTGGVSRYHGVIYKDENLDWFVRDAGSTNGIKVNRVKIEGPTKLCDEDMIEFGDQMIRVFELYSSAPKIIFNPIGSAPEDTEPAPEVKSMLIENSNFDSKHLFARAAAGDAGTNEGQPPGKSPKRISNLSFYSVIFLVVLAVVVWVIKLNEVKKPKDAPGAKEAANRILAVAYDREKVTKDNVFKFAMLLENNKVKFTLDDLKTERHYEREFDLKNSVAENVFKDRVFAANLLQLKAPETPRNSSGVTRNIVVVTNLENRNFKIAGEVLPREIEMFEMALDTFAESFGLETIALTPEELKAQAQNSFLKAEDLYANREANSGNLREAIIRYRQTVEYLSQFSPRPEIWVEARKKLDEAEELRRTKLEQLEFERVRLGNLKEYDQLRYVFTQVMQLADVDSKEYDTARQRLFKLDSYLRQGKK